MNKREIHLSEAVPEFLLEYRELRELYHAEEPEFQGYVDTGTSMLDEMFIQTATDIGLSRFEGILGIGHGVGESLETRRKIVMARWWNMVPYTLRVLKRRLGVLQGNDKVKIWFTDNEPYRIHIQTSLEDAALWPEMKALIEEMLPANLARELLNLIEIESVPAPVGVATLAGYVARQDRANMALLQLRDAAQTAPAEGNHLTGVYALTGYLSTAMAGGKGRSKPIAFYHATQVYAANAAMTTATAKV